MDAFIEIVPPSRSCLSLECNDLVCFFFSPSDFLSPKSARQRAVRGGFSRPQSPPTLLLPLLRLVSSLVSASLTSAHPPPQAAPKIGHGERAAAPRWAPPSPPTSSRPTARSPP